MPVRSSSSSVLAWPDQRQVEQAFAQWARHQLAQPNVARVGYFGSYASGNWGVGSDLDIVVVVHESGEPFVRRAAGFDANALPVPADVLVYTTAEWEAKSAAGDRLTREVRWASSPAEHEGKTRTPI